MYNTELNSISLYEKLDFELAKVKSKIYNQLNYYSLSGKILHKNVSNEETILTIILPKDNFSVIILVDRHSINCDTLLSDILTGNTIELVGEVESFLITNPILRAYEIVKVSQ